MKEGMQIDEDIPIQKFLFSTPFTLKKLYETSSKPLLRSALSGNFFVFLEKKSGSKWEIKTKNQ